MDHAFSNRLLLVPLFQGFSRLDFLDIVEKTPFDFRTLAHGATLILQGDEARALCIVLGGEVDCEAESADHTYRLCETLSAPRVLQPECLFGLHNRFTHTVRARGEAQTVLLEKQHVRRLLTENETFQINFYNLLSTFTQQCVSQLWPLRALTVEERFRTFVRSRCIRPSGPKRLQILMTDLATELGTSRLRVSRMLATLADGDKLSYSRGSITIPALERL